MAKRRTKRAVKKPQSAVDNNNDSEEKKLEKQLPALSAHEVDRRVTTIVAIRDAENEHLLTRLRLLRSYLSKDQLKIPAVQFFKENLPNMSVIFNEDGEYELEWNAKCRDIRGNDDAERNMHATIPHRSSIAYPSDYVAAMPNISGFEFSSKAVEMSFLEAASLNLPDIDLSETLKLGFQDTLQTPRAISQRLSVGMTPKTIRLPKHGEMLLSVHGSPLGVHREDNMEAIHAAATRRRNTKQIVEMGVATGAVKSINRSNSLPKLDVSGAAIQGGKEERDPPILLPNQSDDISHLAIDIGGTLTKLVYFSRHADDSNNDDKRKMSMKEKLGISNHIRSYPILGGQLHFVKFETQKLNECLDFISSKQLHRGGIDLHNCYSPDGNATIKATGGGAYKFADLVKERLGVSLDKEDEMGCLVAGANFLLKAIPDEAFTHMKGHKEFVQIDHNDFFPYLLVTIGSGVSINKVDGDGSYQRVTGSSIGGRTYLGLAWLLTKHKSFDELLELSKRGDNRNIDMLVGDIYGGDYSKIGLSSSTIASSFGKVTYESKEPSEYKPEDLSLSLLRMISYNISQISHSTARDYGIKRIVFGGFFICGHAYTMDMISDAINYWSKGQVQAMFLRHEGFLGALGAFMSYEKHGLDDLMGDHLVERYLMCAPYMEGMIHGLPLGHPNEKALVSEGGTDDNAKGRGDGFAQAFSAHLASMSSSNNNSCEWAPKCPRCNRDMISFTQSSPNQKFWRCPNWNNENGRATFLWKDKASRQQLSETNSMPMQRDNGKEELQDLAVLMEDLKKTIEMQNRFLCASIEEKKEMKKFSDLQNLYLRKIYRVTVFISCIICLSLAFLFNLA